MLIRVKERGLNNKKEKEQREGEERSRERRNEEENKALGNLLA